MGQHAHLDRTAPAQDMAQAIFPPDVAVVAADPRRALTGLLPEEAEHVARAVENRRREYAAGRVAARQAMRVLGLPPQPVLSGPDRAPIWPDGIAGSLSHTNGCCLAAIGRASAMRTLGVDIERDGAVSPKLRGTICRPEELSWLECQPAAERARLATLIFSAKECAYKCQYPLTRMLFGFDQLLVEIDTDQRAFRAVFMAGAGGFRTGDALEGNYRIGAGFVVTGLWIRQGEWPGCGGVDQPMTV